MSNNKKRTHDTGYDKIGMQLENGATILQASTDGTVLCLWKGEFVTWITDPEDNERNAHWGHYNGHDLEAAIRDFESR